MKREEKKMNSSSTIGISQSNLMMILLINKRKVNITVLLFSLSRLYWKLILATTDNNCEGLLQPTNFRFNCSFLHLFSTSFHLSMQIESFIRFNFEHRTHSSNEKKNEFDNQVKSSVFCTQVKSSAKKSKPQNRISCLIK